MGWNNNMKLSMTATTMNIREKAPIVFRGPLEQSLKEIAEIGYDGVEVHIHDSDLIDRAELKKLLETWHLDLTSIGTGSAYGWEHLFLASEDSQIRQKAIRRLRGHMITAKDYDHAVVIIGLIKGKIADCSNAEGYRKNLISSLKECIKWAEEYKVMLGIEIINRYESDTINTIEEGLKLLEEVPSKYLKLHIDTYHMNIEEGDIFKAIESAKGKICHVHIADNDRWYAGHGHYNFKETIDALNHIGYDKSIAIESFYYPDAKTSGRRSYECIKKLLGGKGYADRH